MALGTSAGASLAISACRDTNADERDQLFRAMVLEVMPEFRLVPELIGEDEIIASPGYALQVGPPGAGDRSKEGLLAMLVDRLTPYGINRCSVYLGAGNGVREYWEARFPGCSPDDCQDALSGSTFHRSSREEFDYFSGRWVSHMREDLVVGTVDDVRYRSELSVHFDAGRRVTDYSVISYRAALTASEERFAQHYSFRGDMAVPVFQYLNSLTLGVDIESSGPHEASIFLGGL